MEKKALTKEELIARLKEIAADSIKRDKMFMGAMCYSPAMPPIQYANCEMCGADITYCDWHSEGASIVNTVKDIAALGYDAKVEICCEECALRLTKELNLRDKSILGSDGDYLLYPINYLFSFKPKDGEQYHLCIANDEDQYNSLYSLLTKKATYKDYRDAEHYIADEKDTLEYMTGINFDEQD